MKFLFVPWGVGEREREKDRQTDRQTDRQRQRAVKRITHVV